MFRFNSCHIRFESNIMVKTNLILLIVLFFLGLSNPFDIKSSIESTEIVVETQIELVKACIADETLINIIKDDKNRQDSFSHFNQVENHTFKLYSLYFLDCAVRSNVIRNKEIYLIFSIIFWPKNHIAYINIANLYEWNSLYQQSQSIYSQCIERTQYIMCKVLPLLSFPSSLESDLFVLETFKTNLQSLVQLITDQSHLIQSYYELSSSDLILKEIFGIKNAIDLYLRSDIGLPMNLQYTGYPSSLIYYLISKFFKILDPSLEKNMIEKPSVNIFPLLTINEIKQKTLQKKIKVGIIAESHNNSSPGLVYQEILRKLSTDSFNVSGSKSNHYLTKFELIFFDLPHLDTHFASEMRILAPKVILLDTFDLNESRSLVSEANLDILIYLALPTIKFTYLLAHSRLAPIQIQFGIGHPISSGIQSIDFSVISYTMSSYGLLEKLENANYLTPKTENESKKNLLLSFPLENYLNSKFTNTSIILPNNRSFDRFKYQIYSEQLVFFDSLGYYLEDTKTFYRDDPIIHKTLLLYQRRRAPQLLDWYEIDSNLELTCSIINLQLLSWKITKVKAEDLGCVDVLNSADEISPLRKARCILPFCRYHYAVNYGKIFEVHIARIHLINLMQTKMKFHPLFDDILIGLIQAGIPLKFVAFSHLSSILPRILKSMQSSGIRISSETLNDYFIFIERMNHPDYLILVSLSSLFINPFPFGSGITSSEALSMCVPVISYLDQTSVLHIAATQVIFLNLPLNITNLLLPRSKKMFVENIKLLLSPKEKWLNMIRNQICSRQENLFGRQVLEDAANEWAAFLHYVTS